VGIIWLHECLIVQCIFCKGGHKIVISLTVTFNR
jgi:hypothetical protein